ncbi:hypothetical protein [Ensifer sp.]|jgi:hypothetical protein|uniref:hypothetical protein n=1 Tax=Ensifer sp. TaxID=1872086 RepID=UPI002E0F13B5|nr:hypothetical protein [Ensifer sp.]
MRKLLAVIAIVAVTLAAALYLLLRFATGPISDGILANAVGPEDFELPPTYFPVGYTGEDVQVVGGMAAGLDCSLPPGVGPVAFPRGSGEANISLQMRQACVNHDYCYRHGNATYGLSQAECDFALQEQAFRLCSQINVAKGIPECETEARKVTLGVRVGGAGSFRRADALDRASTYFEYDPNPTTAEEFMIVRVADAPLMDAASDFEPKALYRFQVRQGGALLRVVAFRKTGGTACAEFAFSGRFGSITSVPVVNRAGGGGPDWLLWWRRDREDNTGGILDGIAPARATLGDWRALGASPEFGNPSCSLSIPETDTAIATQKAVVASLHYDNRFGLRGDGLVPEFHPAQSEQSSARAGELVLLGLTSHTCSGPNAANKSTCVGRLSLDTSLGIASFEPFRTLDANCTNGHKGCDQYRNFAAHPLVLTREGVAGLAWLRRGFSTTFPYSDGATLRWAPARNAVNEKPNYVDWDVNLAEREEPVALSSAGEVAALVSLSKSSACGEGHAVALFPLEAEGRPVRRIDKCIAELTDQWVTRPYFVVDQRKIVFVQGAFQGDAAATERPFTVTSLTVDLDGLAVSGPTPPREAFRARICKSERGDATDYLALSDCGSGGSRFGRIRADADVAKTLARLANRTAIMPAAIKADGSTSLVIATPAEFGAVVALDVANDRMAATRSHD